MLITDEQIQAWKTDIIAGEASTIVYGRYDLRQHLDRLQEEFCNKPRLCFAVAELIVRLRRSIEPDQALKTFNHLLETELDFLCAELDSRWLVSVADTLADFGPPNERLGAMISVTMVNMVKLAETEHKFATDANPDENKRQAVLGGQPPLPLWDGVSSYWIDSGDMPSNLFRRCRETLSVAPVSRRIFDTLVERLQQHPNCLSRLAQYNPHFWK